MRSFISEKNLLVALSLSLLVLWAGLAFSSALVEVSTVFALIFWLTLKLQNRTWVPPQINYRLLIPLGLYVLIIMLSLFWSEHPKQSSRGILKILQDIFIFFAVAETFSDKKRMRHFELTCLIIMGIVVIDSLIQYIFGKDILRGFAYQPAEAGPRVTGPFKIYGLLACYIISIIPYLTLLGIRYRNIERNWNWWYICFVCLIGAIGILFLTRSRGAFFAFFLSLFISFIFYKKWRWIFALLLLVGTLAFILPRPMIIHLDSQRKEQSLVERFYLWQRAIDVIKAKPLQGTGINTYAASHAAYDRQKNWRVKNYYAHNGYLQIAAETGLPSLIFFLAFILNILIRGLIITSQKSKDPNLGTIRGLLICLVAFLVFASVDTIMHNAQSRMLFWFMLGLTCAYFGLTDNKTKGLG